MTNSVSFDPLFSNNNQYSPKVIILGSSPSVVSQKLQQYYAHPRNSFWWIMSEMFCFDPLECYEHKVKAIIRSGVYLWDVLMHCERDGSLDSKILRQSEQANDIQRVLETYQSISLICFNGQAAHAIFKRHFSPSLLKEHDLEYHVLPSTSPAHASMRPQEKLQHWEVIKHHLENNGL